ncbi:MAG: TlpA disulfide reductase family protein [Chloroflexota bacterium]|nr:TlpA disulfide reductase family protein [Chloroflexota bacterium]
MTESEPRGPMRRYGGYAVLGTVVVAVAVLVVWLFAFGGDDDGEPAPLLLDRPELLGTVGLETGVIDGHAPEVGKLAPDFALANARDPERVVRLSDFRGTPVVLNWYASWCGPCKREIPDFQKAYQALDGEVVFLGVNLQEDAAQAAGLLDVFVAKYPALLDTEGEVAVHYRIPGMPTTFFIDADGIVRSMGAGLIVEEVLVEELARIGVTYEPVDP